MDLRVDNDIAGMVREGLTDGSNCAANLKCRDVDAAEEVGAEIGPWLLPASSVAIQCSFCQLNSE